jgi:vitamin B12/bleomycin/antimicrobial peptide transport system ATP-binding/permease protein
VALREALRSVESLHATEGRITYSDHPEGKLALENVEVYLPDSLSECAMLVETKVEIGAGEHIAVAGETAAGKTTMFLALADLWPWGKGTIQLPPRDQMMFLPQQPYLPLGSLRNAICYPDSPAGCSEEAVRSALSRVGLERLADTLDQAGRWDRDLSLAEQQALGCARVLLLSPKWVFIDDALSALELSERQSLMETFQKELAGSTVISTGRSNSQDRFYGKAIHLRRCPRSEPAPQLAT